MAIVTVKNRFQVVIPQRVREEVGVEIGDVLEARAVKGKIVFEPRSMVNRGIAEGLEDIEKGRVYGPYRTAKEAMKAFQERGAGAPSEYQPGRDLKLARRSAAGGAGIDHRRDAPKTRWGRDVG